MDKKTKANIVLIIIAIILAGGLGYIVLMKIPELSKGTQTDNLEDFQNASPFPISGNISQTQPPTELTVISPVSLPATCKDKEEGAPVITSLSNYTGGLGTILEIRGCNFLGFEGDKNSWIQNENGKKGILYGETGSTGKLIIVTLNSPLCTKDTSYSGLPCDEELTLTTGIYKIYTEPWGAKSNEATFILTE